MLVDLLKGSKPLIHRESRTSYRMLYDFSGSRLMILNSMSAKRGLAVFPSAKERTFGLFSLT